ncbi:MAG: phosphodiester glycosidase family protein [Clostridia bacterium]|nr:phosphodiester glycosidase family protein [Clostridia bacterium]
MIMPLRILLALLCAVMVVSSAFVISSPTILEDALWEMQEQLDSEAEESGFLSLFVASARAEAVESEYSLPIDTSAGMKPDTSLFTPDGYEDASIRVQMETREENGVVWRIAWVEVASPTQLRTAYAGKTIKKDTTGLVTVMAKQHNAIVAINGDNYTNEKAKHSFIYRMGEKRQDKLNKQKDILIIDENGDFHTFIKSAGADKFEKDTGHQIINAFMFGPALVQNGEVLKLDKEYNFNPNGREPRCAIGQLDTLSYVLVIADGRGNSGSDGATHQELAEFMASLGCREAYNLDGGNSAIMVYNNEIYNYKARERDVADVIYFATAVPSEGK